MSFPHPGMMAFHYQLQSRITGEGVPGRDCLYQGGLWVCPWSGIIIPLTEEGRPTRCEWTGDPNLCEHKHSHSLLSVPVYGCDMTVSLELLPLRPPTVMNNSLELQLKTLFSAWLLLSGYLIRTVRTKLWLH